jgi:hypothetical protein
VRRGAMPAPLQLGRGWLAARDPAGSGVGAPMCGHGVAHLGLVGHTGSQRSTVAKTA